MREELLLTQPGDGARDLIREWKVGVVQHTDFAIVPQWLSSAYYSFPYPGSIMEICTSPFR